MDRQARLPRMGGLRVRGVRLYYPSTDCACVEAAIYVRRRYKIMQ